MIDPTREEWQAARDALADEFADEFAGLGLPLPDLIAKTALGPCPPEPEPFGKDEGALVWWGTQGIHVPGQVLTPDEAEAMADALYEHAAYAHEPPERCACGLISRGLVDGVCADCRDRRAEATAYDSTSNNPPTTFGRRAK